MQKKRRKKQEQHKYELSLEASRQTAGICKKSKAGSGSADVAMGDAAGRDKVKKNVHSGMTLRRNMVVRGVRVGKSEDKEKIRRILREEEDARKTNDAPMT
jgi:hypothetical protein